MKRHTALAGEDLYSIGLRYHVAIDHLMMANGIQTLQVSPGRVLRVPTQRVVPAFLDTGLVLNLPERMIYLFKDKKLIAYYPVAIGATGKWMTPVADLTIINMAKNPTWLPPEWAGKEKPVEPGPDNPLGDRWIGLSMPGYGIHATNAPTSIGLATSHGCIRMIPRDAEALYDRVRVGMAVKIVYEPVLIGRAPDTGLIYLSVYPDVYGKVGDMKAFLAQKLQKYGIEEVADRTRADMLLAAKKGVPEPIVGSTIQLRIQDELVTLSFPIIVRDGKYLAVSDFLEPLGALAKWDETRKSLEITRNEKKITLFSGGSGSPQEATLLLWHGKALLPLRDVVQGLGLSLSWDNRERAISIVGASYIKPSESIKPENREAWEERKYEDRVRAVEERF
jgi:L,D-transpeptidase ErfK/SrfK